MKTICRKHHWNTRCLSNLFIEWQGMGPRSCRRNNSIYRGKIWFAHLKPRKVHLDLINLTQKHFLITREINCLNYSWSSINPFFRKGYMFMKLITAGRWKGFGQEIVSDIGLSFGTQAPCKHLAFLESTIFDSRHAKDYIRQIESY